MPTDNDSAAKFAESIEDAYTHAAVSPHWIENSDCFWYRRDVRPGEFSFIFVDAGQAIRRPTFDHERLAKALNDHDIDASANALPFSSVDPSSDGKSIKFRIGEKKWEFLSDGELTEYDGEICENTLDSMQEEKPSGSSQKDTAINFVNQTKEPISLFWIDFDGKAQLYATVDAGRSNRRPTYTDHVWRVVNAETKKPIASFIAQDGESTAIIRSDMSSKTKLVDSSDKEENPEECQSPDSETEGSEDQQKLKTFVKDFNV